MIGGSFWNDEPEAALGQPEPADHLLSGRRQGDRVGHPQHHLPFLQQRLDRLSKVGDLISRDPKVTGQATHRAWSISLVRDVIQNLFLVLCGHR